MVLFTYEQIPKHAEIRGNIQKPEQQECATKNLHPIEVLAANPMSIFTTIFF